MNIFILSDCPKLAAEYMIDKHIVKMPTESLQMLSTILHHYAIPAPFKPVMLNHPCTIWARKSYKNFNWLIDHCYALCKEYTIRYNKKHKVEEHMDKYEQSFLECSNLLKEKRELDKCLTPFAQAMPDKYKDDDAIKAYRQYYLGDKWDFATWKTGTPSWWPKDHIIKKKQEQIIKFNKQFNANVPLE